MFGLFKLKSNDWVNILPDFACHERVLSRWCRNVNVHERIPLVVCGLILRFSTETDKENIHQQIKMENLQWFITFSLKYQWWQYLDYVWRWCNTRMSLSPTNETVVIVADILKKQGRNDFLALLKRDQFYLREECIFIIAMEWCKFQMIQDVEVHKKQNG
ncbi:hypothetical protein RFI_17994 [Reticulomyxa filosa]|uniref:Uncharacterized protein n=1 Tax=Reticulomyxa filosa TaxID=46433 RepID=X6MZH9_RETFI|nr:hypothetical protein RFI_17994 [Reticulomyxa filosa]|eukprot:ETO19236.1 hypothetical protein RFI_17994 [Reticulomyxa filosa]